jgi:hypothetical protein
MIFIIAGSRIEKLLFKVVLHGPVGTIGAAQESLMVSIPVVCGRFATWYRQLRIKQKPYVTVFMGM